ncbi:MAG: Ig-like domain-containing protein [Clostridiales bacterium]|jgi:hypothetical protein|nr:Ig-like domain-containing protein [Clostridiales bacterium]
MKRLIRGALPLALLLALSLAVRAEAGDTPKAYKTYIKTVFDGSAGWDGANFTDPLGAGALYADWKTKTAVSVTDAPVPETKLAGSSFSEGGRTDKSLKIALNAATSGDNYYFNQSYTNNTDMYGSTLKLSFNLYIDSIAGNSHAAIQGLFFNSSSLYSNLFALRNGAANNVRIFYASGASDTGNNTYKTFTYAAKRWHNFTFEIDTVNKTYTFYRDGVRDSDLTDVPLARQDMHFGGDPNPSAGKMNQLRFAAGVSSGQTVNGTAFFLDDLYFGRESDAVPLPSFVKAVSLSGAEYTDANTLPKDVKQIVVGFPYDMDYGVLHAKASLTRGAGGTAVPFTDGYDTEEKQYTVELTRGALPSTEYTLTFARGIRTSAAADSPNADAEKGITLEGEVSVKFSTETADFVLADVYFTKTDDFEDRITALSGNETMIYANAVAAYSNLMTQDRDVTILAGVYREDGAGMLTMEKIFLKRQRISVPEEQGAESLNLQIPVELGGLAPGFQVGAFVLSNTDDALPLSETLFIE